MRILIVGIPGSGKTTLAMALAKELSLPHIEVDTLFAGERFLEKVEDGVLKDAWIIEGHFTKIQRIVLPHVDVLIWLKPLRALSHYRVIKRALKNRYPSEIYHGLKEYNLRTAAFKNAYDSLKKNRKTVLLIHEPFQSVSSVLKLLNHGTHSIHNA